MSYTAENVRRRIKETGALNFMRWILEADLSDTDMRQLDSMYIMANDTPCLSAIYLLAQ